MNPGDYYILIVLVVLIGGTLLYGLFAMFAPNNKGAWDDTSRIVAKLRGKKYTYRDYDENATKFLLKNQEQLAFWPAPEAAAAHDLVSSKQNIVWRSCGIHTVQSRDLYFTFQVPQRSDGLDFSSPEIFFTAAAESGDNAVHPEEQGADRDEPQFTTDIDAWHAIALSADVTAAYQDSQIANWLGKMHGFKAMHVVGSEITLVVANQKFDATLLQLYPQLETASSAIIAFLPECYWK